MQFNQMTFIESVNHDEVLQGNDTRDTPCLAKDTFPHEGNKEFVYYLRLTGAPCAMIISKRYLPRGSKEINVLSITVTQNVSVAVTGRAPSPKVTAPRY